MGGVRASPVHCRVQVVLVGIFYRKVRGESRVGKTRRRSQLGVGPQYALCDHGQHQIAFTAGLGGNQAGHLQPLHRAFA